MIKKFDLNTQKLETILFVTFVYELNSRENFILIE